MSQLEKLKAKLQEQPDAAQAIAAEFGNPDKVKAALLRFAEENGIPVTEAELVQSQAGADGVLSEADLAQVAGGGVVAAVAFSVLTLGLGCAFASIEAAKTGKDCGKELKDIEFRPPGSGNFKK